jgi:uncharacterized protein YjbI with pentapeptide repeats
MKKYKLFKQKHHIFQAQPYQWRGQAYYAICVMQIFAFNDDVMHFPKKELMKLNSEALRMTEGELFDMGLPKPHAEFLATGHCYPPEGKARKSFVRINLGDKTKTLVVYGNRYWQGTGLLSKISEPEEFSKMPLTNAQAFGGKDYSYNPIGKGFAYVEPEKKGDKLKQMPKFEIDFPEFPEKKSVVDDQSIPKMFSYPLPNTENPNDLILKKNDMPLPATFYPIPASNRERTKKFGTFDQKWLKTTWPHFADDMQWHYFNCSYPDQQYQTYLRGDEEFCIEHMHPHKAKIKGQLPKWQIRAFCEKTTADGSVSYDEIPMQLDTVWFLPDYEKGIVIWHGYTPIADLKASNVEALQIVDVDMFAELKDKAYYLDQLKKAKQRPTLKERTEEQAKKLKPHQEAAQKKAIADYEQKLLAHKQKIQSHLSGVADKFKAMAEQCKDVTTKEKLLEMSKNSIIPMGIMSWEERMAKIQEGRDYLEKNNLKFFKPGTDYKIELARLQQHIKGRIQEKLDSAKSIFKGQKIDVDSYLKDLEKEPAAFDPQKVVAAAHATAEATNDPAVKASILAAIATYSSEVVPKIQQHLALGQKVIRRREQAIELLAQKQALNGYIAQVVDLSGLDFSEQDLTKIKLIHCDLRNCNFAKSNLTNALLMGSDCSGANFSNAILFNARLDETKLDDTNFSKADCEQAKFSKSVASNINFSHANLQQSKLLHIDWQTINFQGADATKTIIQKAKFKNINMNDAIFQRCHFSEGDWQDIDFSGCDLSKTMIDKLTFNKLPAYKTNLESVKFHQCKLTELSLQLAKASKMKFISCELQQCLITETDMQSTHLSDTKCYDFKCLDSDLSNMRGTRNSSFVKFRGERCNFTKASLINCEMPEAIFKRCDFSNAFLQDSNLYHSQFLYCVMLMTRLMNTNLQSAKFYYCNLQQGLLREANIVTASFKHCNLYAVDFYHAITKNTVMHDNLMQDPLPPNFTEMFCHG